MANLTHLDDQGNARMVDVSSKEVTERSATAEGLVRLSPTAFEALKAGSLKKGDALGVARIAAIMAAKRTDELIPLCHPLPISGIDVSFTLNDADGTVAIEATVRVTGRTGVEMEAMTAVSVAALTIYDMCKGVDKGITIEEVRLVAKDGGKGGSYRREERIAL